MIPFNTLLDVLLMCLLIVGTTSVDYCAVKSCQGKEHTMCKYTSEAMACSGVKGITQELQKVILDRHNVHRRTTAMVGKPQPTSSNMLKLKWHEEAAKIAQRWANQCKSEHDTCRDLKDSKAGQNFASRTVSGAPDLKAAVTQMIDDWFAEVKDFDKNQIEKFKYANNIAHYTQLVWAETTAVGCGIIKKESVNNYVTINLFCNYVPAGNIIDNAVYKVGKPCSECPRPSHCSNEYLGLCTEDQNDFGGDPTKGGVGKGGQGGGPGVYDPANPFGGGLDNKKNVQKWWRTEHSDGAVAILPRRSVCILLCFVIFLFGV